MMFADAAKSLGYHPFPVPVAIASAPYTSTPTASTLGACEYCGFCNRTACEANAKASPNVNVMPVLRADPKFELRTRAFVSQAPLRQGGASSVTGVLYTDLKTGEEYEQPAGIVVLSSFVFGNTQYAAARRHRRALRSRDRQGRRRQELLLPVRSGARRLLRGQGAQSLHGLARHARRASTISTARISTTPGSASSAAATSSAASGGAPPIDGRALPHGTPRWGSEWKRATVKWYYHYVRFNTQGSVYANRDNYHGPRSDLSRMRSAGRCCA